MCIQHYIYIYIIPYGSSRASLGNTWGDDLGGQLPSQSLCLDHFGSIGYVVHLHKLGNGTSDIGSLNSGKLVSNYGWMKRDSDKTMDKLYGFIN